RTGPQHLAKSDARYVLHREERALSDLAGIVDRRYRGMGQRCREARLADETPSAILVPHSLRRQHLQRDDTPELFVVREVDDAHAAGTEQLRYTITTESLADEIGRRDGWDVRDLLEPVVRRIGGVAGLAVHQRAPRVGRPSEEVVGRGAGGLDTSTYTPAA